jgi:beta-glucosidase
VQPFHAVSFLEGIGNVAGANAAVLHSRGVPSLAAMASRTQFTTAATDGQPGVTFETFDNADLSGAPTSTKVDRAMSFGRPLDIISLLGSEEPVDVAAMMGTKAASGMRWTGWYTPKTTGAQDFFVQQGGFGGSGARLFVDGKKVIDTWEQASAIVGQASVDLDTTPHKVVLELHTAPGGFGGPFVRAGAAPRGAWVDPNAVKIAASADVALVAVGFDPATESEGWDRTFGLPPGQDELVRQVAAANKNTIVILTGGGGVDMSRWIDQVPTIIETWFPGQEGGTALGEILFGVTSPSGHLPATFERRLEDNPAFNTYYPKAGTLQVPYSEGVFVGYRGYEKNGTQPLFPFGHGLSYTTFSYTNLSVAPDAESSAPQPRWTVSFDITNTGQRTGAAVAQVYVSEGQAKVARPAKELKGFAKVALQPGETRRVTVPLDLRSLAYYDVAGKQWKADAGTFTVRVGGSSTDLSLSAPLVLARTATHP